MRQNSCVIVLSMAGVSNPAFAQVTTRVSLSTAGVEGNGNLHSPVVSADGRLVAFESDAADLVAFRRFSSNLVPGDTNGFVDVFVRDHQAGLTTRVSLSTAGAQGNNASHTPSNSANGRFVTFESNASTLVADDTNTARDVFVHDVLTARTMRVSVSSSGAQGNGGSDSSSITVDGGRIAFESSASNLVTGDTNSVDDVFVRDWRCPGDANGDGVVDFIDLNHVLTDFGMIGAGLLGDLDGDGDCDFVDLNLVLAHFGVSC